MLFYNDQGPTYSLLAVVLTYKRLKRTLFIRTKHNLLDLVLERKQSFLLDCCHPLHELFVQRSEFHFG